MTSPRDVEHHGDDRGQTSGPVSIAASLVVVLVVVFGLVVTAPVVFRAVGALVYFIGGPVALTLALCVLFLVAAKCRNSHEPSQLEEDDRGQQEVVPILPILLIVLVFTVLILAEAYLKVIP